MNTFRAELNNRFSTSAKDKAINEVKGTISSDINDTIGISSYKLKDFVNDFDGNMKSKDILALLHSHGVKTNTATTEKLEKAGWISKVGRGVFTLSKHALSYVDKEDKLDLGDVEELGNNKEVHLSSKVTKYNAPKGAKSSRFDDFFGVVLSSMRDRIKGEDKTPLMLKGDPGTAKTSSVSQIATLFGMELITIEGAHISEEQLINIPYVITRGSEVTKGVDSYEQGSNGEYTIVSAESALVSRMDASNIIKEQEWMQMLNKNKLMKAYFNEYEDYIRMVRKSTVADKSGFSIILFLDEFYRTGGNKKVQNILRTVMNGYIGTTEIPKNAYLIYASNFNNDDGSLDEIPLNNQFENVQFDVPSKVDFLDYIANSLTPVDVETGEEDSEKDLPYQLSSTVYNAFADTIGESDLGSTSNEVRISPRRMEQIMIYVNSKIPASTENDRRNLITYIRSQFTDPITSLTSDLLPKYEAMVNDLLGTKNQEPQVITEWKSILEDQIDAKLDIGNKRTYPVMLSGLPGVAKTVTLKKVAKDRNMGLIYIDASTLNLDDVVGIPVPKGDDNNLETVFTEPPLYALIMKMYNEQLNLVNKDRKYNFVLFIDEFSRAAVSIQNKVRLLLLEKKVNDKYKLPEDIMIVGAMNPVDGGFVSDITAHTKDVIDFIPVEMSINEVESYMHSLSVLDDTDMPLGFNVQDMSFNLLSSLYNRFKSDTNMNGEPNKTPLVYPFNWSTGNDVVIYVSPREIVGMYSKTIQRISDKFMMKKWQKLSDPTEEDFNKFIDLAKNETYKVYKGMLDFIFDKQQIESIDSDKFLEQIYIIIKESTIFDTIKSVKSEEAKNMTFSSMLQSTNYDPVKIVDEGGTIVLENWLNQIDDYSEADNDLSLVYNYVMSEFDALKQIKFFLNMLVLFDDIEWDDTPGGTQDKIFNLHLNRYNTALKAGMDEEGSDSWLDHFDEAKETMRTIRDWKAAYTGTELADGKTSNSKGLFKKA